MPKMNPQSAEAAQALGNLYTRLRAATGDPKMTCDIRYPASAPQPTFHIQWTQNDHRCELTHTPSGLELVQNSLVDGASVMVEIIVGLVELKVAEVRGIALS